MCSAGTEGVHSGMVCTFTVAGVPAPQGSKNPWGGEANPRTRPWRAAVTAAAHEAMGERVPTLGPVKVRARFYFMRPKSHFGSGRNAAIVKDSAPDFHTTFPDLDKLQRAIGDSLTGVVVRDDKQIAAWDVEKIYSESAGVFIRVEAL